MKQTKITLSDKLYKFLKFYADELDIPFAQYLKFILMKEVQNLNSSSRKLHETLKKDWETFQHTMEVMDRYS